MSEESNEELIARYKHVSSLLAKGKKQAQRLLPGKRRDEKFRFLGTLTFTFLTIKSKMEERSLSLV